MRGLILLGLLTAFSAWATPPSLLLTKKAELGEPVPDEAAVRAALERHQALLRGIVLAGETFEIWTKPGEDPFTGKIVPKPLPPSAIDVLWNRASVGAASEVKVQVKAEGKLFQCAIPAIEKGSRVYLRDGRTLLKIQPQFRTSIGSRTPAGSVVVDQFDIQFSEVEATRLFLWVDSRGNVYR